MHNSSLNTMGIGLIGTMAPLLGIITSFQLDIDYYLRITSLCLGIIVGLASLFSIIKNLRK